MPVSDASGNPHALGSLTQPVRLPGVDVGVGVELCEGVAEGVGVGVGVLLGVGVLVGAASWLGVGVGDGEMVGVELGVGNGVDDGVAVAVAVGVGDGVGADFEPMCSIAGLRVRAPFTVPCAELGSRQVR
jgi:hypothetical protein